MSAESIAFLCSIAINVGCIVYQAHRLRRLMQAERIALRTAELLRDICLRAYMNQHRPIWQAWAQVMGSYRIKVAAIRNELEDYDA